MNIQYATLDDIEQIYKIMRQIGRIAYTKNLVIDLINSEDSICLKLLENGQIAGVLGARAEGKNSYWLYFIVVKEEYREKGYAKEMMDKLFEEVKKKGVKRIALDTPDKDFFEKFGFKEIGRIPNWYEDKDQVIMFKVLE
jgi:ribosomal protein S18 acetylase RimI-like enzyme